jgi:Rrf2 family iron-sulfur cluster assembly transcriptional regulator
MRLVSRKGILVIAAVIEVALNSRRRPVFAKTLAARHKPPSRISNWCCKPWWILKGIRGPHGGYELGREEYFRRGYRASSDPRRRRRRGAAADLGPAQLDRAVCTRGS